MKIRKSLYIQISLLALGFLSTYTFSFSQNDRNPQLQLKAQIPERAAFITTDKLEQLYVVTPDNEVIKYNGKGQELFRYNDNTLGNITAIDATNPFQVMLFYGDFFAITLLDRTLNKITTINLLNLGYMDVRNAAVANDGTVWIYDHIEFKLKKINQRGDAMLESNNFNLLFGKEVLPLFLLERRNWLYLLTDNSGIKVFDTFGKYVKTIPETGFNQIQIVEEKLIFFRDGKLWVRRLDALEPRILIVGEVLEKADAVQIQQDKVFILADEQASIYQVTKP